MNSVRYSESLYPHFKIVTGLAVRGSLHPYSVNSDQFSGTWIPSSYFKLRTDLTVHRSLNPKLKKRIDLTVHGSLLHNLIKCTILMVRGSLIFNLKIRIGLPVRGSLVPNIKIKTDLAVCGYLIPNFKILVGSADRESLIPNLKIRIGLAVRGSPILFWKFGPNQRSVDPFIPFQNFRTIFWHFVLRLKRSFWHFNPFLES